MRKIGFTWLGIFAAAFAGNAFASDRTGILGLNYTVGPSFIAGGSAARDSGGLQPGVGAALQYGLMRNVDATFSYDYIDADLRTQAITFGGQWRVAPENPVCPFAGAGIGFGKPFSGEGWDHFSLKLLGGVEKSITNEISLAGTLSYQFVDGPDPVGSVHAIEPGIRLTYYFGPVGAPTHHASR